MVERWAETPTWQYFSDMSDFELRFPCDVTLIGKFRKLLGEYGLEELLSPTISVALNLKAIPKKALEIVVADSIVQPMADLPTRRIAALLKARGAKWRISQIPCD